MRILNENLILDTDSYKFSHFLQYPRGTTAMYSYFESRGGKFDKTVFFGLQYILNRYLYGHVITADNVNEAAVFADDHGVPFPLKGWKRIVDKHQGRLPLIIRAVPEGTVVPNHNILMSVESTDPEVFWLPAWLETLLVRIWFPVTVATLSYHIRKDIYKYLQETSDDPDSEIWFKLHDFGSRGVSSRESAGIGGAAHLVNFKGSDTVEGIRTANKYYHCDMAAFSISAAEHSTITSWGKDREVDAYRNMLTQFAKPGSLVAVVSDSYDLYNAVAQYWAGSLLEEVKKSGATVVIRPDSGNPPEVVCRILNILEERIGMETNSKGFKVLPDYFRVIQGDGVNQESINMILEAMKKQGYSASNIAFGMGGALLQQINRDTQKFAFKCSEVTIDGKAVAVFKDPVTDPGKRSKAGRLSLAKSGTDYATVPGPYSKDVLQPVFVNGSVFSDFSLDEIRANAGWK